MARAVLWRLAALQATEHDAARDAEPGKILHEMRSGEMAHLCARCRSGAITARVDSTPLFLMLAGAYAQRTGDWDVHPQHLADISRRRSPGSTGPATATATASSNIRAPRRKGSPTRAGRIPTTASSTPTASWRAGRSRCARCRPMSTRPSAASRAAPRALGDADSARRARQRGRRAARALRGAPSGARTSAPMRSRSTATSSPAACAPPMPGTCCSPASRRAERAARGRGHS